MAERKSVTVEDLVVHRPDGGRTPLRAQARPMFGADGTMTHVAVVFSDISREVQVEEERAQVERQLQSVVSSAPLVLFVVDRAGVVRMAKGRGLKRLGMTAEQIVGRTGTELFPGNPSVGGARNARVRAGDTESFVVDLGLASYEIHLSPQYDKAGEFDGTIGVANRRDRAPARGGQARASGAARVGGLARGGRRARGQQTRSLS